MARYIVCVPQRWENDRIVAIPYSIIADTPLQAARAIFASKENLKGYCIGEVCVIEAKAGRLDDWRNFYSLDKIV